MFVVHDCDVVSGDFIELGSFMMKGRKVLRAFDVCRHFKSFQSGRNLVENCLLRVFGKANKMFGAPREIFRIILLRIRGQTLLYFHSEPLNYRRKLVLLPRFAFILR